MNTHLSRRSLLLGAASATALAGLTGAGRADAPLVALRPLARPAPLVRPAAAEFIAAARLGGPVGYMLADARTGLVLEQGDAALPLPPASVTKAVTALYALDTFGAAHRFTTRLIGTGPVTDGVLNGDLVLAGGGDPVLSTDDLATLVARLIEAGVRSVRGGFKVWGGALPYVHEIDPQQQPHLGYNPAVCGLNLNFNRVYFEWTRTGASAGGRYDVVMDARTETLRPDVTMARMTVVDRDLPVYTYADAGGIDDWTVARTALGDNGSRWLPVRRPALYAGDVFRSLAQTLGLALPVATEAVIAPAGTTLAQWQSHGLDTLIRDMLRFSTNLTAEVLGLSTSLARGIPVIDLAASAQAMNRWMAATHGVSCAFVDHSGLGDASDIAAGEMVLALISAGPGGLLRALMKEIPLLDAAGDPLARPPGIVVAKTGTLNFVSGLSGYIRTNGRADLAFAIFCADPGSRSAALQSDEEVPAGASDWNRRAKRLQQELLQRWAVVHAG